MQDVFVDSTNKGAGTKGVMGRRGSARACKKNSKLSLHVNLHVFAAVSPQTWLAHHFLAAVLFRPCVIVVCA